jgi:oligopeptide transport system ATP-binding protein
MLAPMHLSSDAEPVLRVREVSHRYSTVLALDAVSFDLYRAEILGLVGQSGCGKTTLARALLLSPKPTSGSIFFRDVDLTTLDARRLREARRHIQLVFQDAPGALDPTWSVKRLVEEPLVAYGMGDRRQREERAARVLDLVGLPLSEYGRRRPHQLSGGQCQRVCVARSLVLEPEVLVLDEALSALDVIVQAQLTSLFQHLREQLRISLIFISHDIGLVYQLSDRVAVLYGGRICETGPASILGGQARHPYTRSLVSSSEGATSHDREGTHLACHFK